MADHSVSLACPHCRCKFYVGAIELESRAQAVVTCPYCGSIIDLDPTDIYGPYASFARKSATHPTTLVDPTGREF